MHTKDVILELRTKNGLSQEELAKNSRYPSSCVTLETGETDGAFNEEYCKWCYADGKFVYTSIDELIDFLAGNMSNESLAPEQVRAYFEEQLPKLNHWKQPDNK